MIDASFPANFFQRLYVEAGVTYIKKNTCDLYEVLMSIKFNERFIYGFYLSKICT